MTLELISTLSNIATLVVLVSGAIAAVAQFRHVRTGKELQAILAIDCSFAEPDLQAALLYVQDELASKLAQPAYRSELASRGYVDPQTHPEMTVCNWFNEMGTMVAGGFLHEDVFFASFGRLAEYYWRLLSPAIALLRRERGAGQYERFEVLASHAQRFALRHRSGTYPPALPRLRVIDPWADFDRRAGGAG